MEKPAPTNPDPEAESAPKDMDETARLVTVTNSLLLRAGKLEIELIGFHTAQVQMALDVGYIRGAVDLLSKRVDHMVKNGKADKGSETDSHVEIDAHSETTPKK